MNKFVFKNPLVNLILGIVLIVFAVLAMFVFDWMSQFVNIVVAVILIYYSVIRFTKERPKYKNQNALMILSAELVVAILLSVLLVLENLDLHIAIGLVLYLRGFTYLLILQLLKLRTKFINFLIAMFVLTLGAYIYFENPISNEIIEYAIFVALAAYGVLLVVFGAKLFKK